MNLDTINNANLPGLLMLVIVWVGGVMFLQDRLNLWSVFVADLIGAFVLAVFVHSLANFPNNWVTNVCMAVFFAVIVGFLWVLGGGHRKHFASYEERIAANIPFNPATQQPLEAEKIFNFEQVQPEGEDE